MYTLLVEAGHKALCVGACAVVAPDEAHGEVMQAPAAPRHETIVRDDDRDWTKEQMARAQEQAATSLPRGPPKAPEKGAPPAYCCQLCKHSLGVMQSLQHVLYIDVCCRLSCKPQPDLPALRILTVQGCMHLVRTMKARS